MHPQISLVMPVYNTKASWLYESIGSICSQSFENWELCICDNGSNKETTELLKSITHTDDRIKLVRLDINEGGYAGVNAALDIAAGDFIGLMDADDSLPQYALELIAREAKAPTKILYTDEMITDAEGEATMPFLKPDFNRELLCILHYFGHLTLYVAALIKKLRLRHCGGSYDYDLALRASDWVSKEEVRHIDVMLYNYRTHPESTSATTRQTCIDGGLVALQEHLDRNYPNAVARLEPPFYGVTLANGEDLKVPVTINPRGWDFWLLPDIFKEQV